MEVVADVAEEVVEDSHEISDAENDDDLFDDLNDEADQYDFFNGCLIDVNVVFQMVILQNFLELPVEISFHKRHQIFVSDNFKNANDSVTFEQEQDSAVFELKNDVERNQKEEIDSEVAFEIPQSYFGDVLDHVVLLVSIF